MNSNWLCQNRNPEGYGLKRYWIDEHDVMSRSDGHSNMEQMDCPTRLPTCSQWKKGL